MTTETVYVLLNEAMPGLIKIGVTGQSELEARMRQLYTTGVPLPFTCYYACKVPIEKNVEKRLHFAFSSHRINQNREFFRVDPEKVKSLLEMVQVADSTEEVRRELEGELTENDKIAAEVVRLRRPAMNYAEMNIPVGSELVYKDGVSKVRVIDERKIEYQGEVMSLTNATRLISGVDYAVQPGRFWTYQNKTINEIYEETYPSFE